MPRIPQKRRHRPIESLESRTLLAADFTLVAMSDSQYTVESFPQIFRSQTQWAADHAADPAHNVAFVAHQGDMLRRGYSTAQATTAQSALSVMDGVIPYNVSIGNHDYDNQFDDLDHHISSARFTSYFGDGMYAANPASGFGGSSLDQRNHYQIFSAGGRQFMVMGIEWEAPDASIAWAQSVIDSHRHLPVILSTHEYLRGGARSTTPLDPLGNSGEAIFQKLVKPNPQIFLVLSGHTSTVAHQTSLNSSANPDYATVFETASDFEGRPNGGNGWMQLFHFYPDQNQVSVSSYSPWLDQFDASSSTYRYDLSIDFNRRFGFANEPIANDDRFETAPDLPIVGNVIANDYDVDDVLTASLASGPGHGSLVFNADGSFDYTPDAGYRGDDAFTYSVADGSAAGNTAKVVLRMNTAPAAVDDAATTPIGKSVAINVLANDTDADGDAKQSILSRLPAHGAVFANANGTFTYTPDPKFVGGDTFSYVVSDGKTRGNEVLVSVSVTSAQVAYDYPIAETTTTGTRSGSYLNLAASDGVEETISGTAVSQRWQFNVTGGSEVTFAINARRTWGTDEYRLQYSTNGSTWLDMAQIVPASSRSITRVNYDADEPYQMWRLPSTTKGTLYVRATDTEVNSDLCSLIVDEMFVMSTGTPVVPPPAAPTSLTATYSKQKKTATLKWRDNASNESGYKVWYSTNGGSTWNVYATLGANATTFTTSALTRNVTYLFKVSAFNAGSESAFSNTVSVLAT
jgi:hypothetical protein